MHTEDAQPTDAQNICCILYAWDIDLLSLSAGLSG